MSNRNKWAHWSKTRRKPETAKGWLVGTALLILGGLLVWSGVQGLQDHVLWFPSFDFRFGKPATGLTVSLLLVGGVFILSGLAALFGPK
jgi:hypothetical protein